MVLSAVGLVTVSVVSCASAPLPSKTIFPLPKVIAFAASVEPETIVVPTKVVPIKFVEVKDDKPAKVVTVPPKLIEVDPIVKDELAKLLFAIEDAVDSKVPVSLGKVRVLSEPVASAAGNIYSFASAVDPSNVIFPPAIAIALAASATPAINVVEAKEVNPVKVP